MAKIKGWSPALVFQSLYNFRARDCPALHSSLALKTIHLRVLGMLRYDGLSEDLPIKV